MLRIFLLLIVITLSSCSVVSKATSPVIYFSNASPEEITGIRAIWADGNVLTLNRLNPGDTRSQSFYIGSDSDFFGLIRVSWTNGRGEGVSREFFFRERNLPEISDDSIYNYVQLYLEQHDFEIMSSNDSDLESKTKRRDAVLNFYKSQASGKASQSHVPTSLIRVEQTADRSAPGWLRNSF